MLSIPTLNGKEKSSISKQGGKGQGISMVEVKIDNFVFNCRTAGMSNRGDGIILLHGFPETSHMWLELMTLLSSKGFRVVAPDQRGYSPGARPRKVSAYKFGKLVDDIFSMADSFGFNQFHLVGHDWGASIGWGMVAVNPDRVISWTAMSVPHLKAFGEALKTDDDQKKKSRYFGFFKLPFIPELYFSFNNYQKLKNIWDKSSAEEIEAYLQVFKGKAALKASLNWYRANIGSVSIKESLISRGNINTPSQLIWGNKDMALGRRGTELTEKFMKGPYRFIEIDAGHWLIQEAYEEVSASILELIEKNTNQ